MSRADTTFVPVRRHNRSQLGYFGEPAVLTGSKPTLMSLLESKHQTSNGVKMRLSRKSSREVLDELNKPAADTPQRLKTFARLRELARKLKRQGFVFDEERRRTPTPTHR